MIEHTAASGKVSRQAASAWFGISRQAYYQARQRAVQRAAEEQLIAELVQGIRQRHPRMGGRKLFHELQASMNALGIQCGRDTFFKALSGKGLLVQKHRNRRHTTYSGLWRYPNLLTDLQLVRPHQAWVADITYLTTEAGFTYLALITDVFSRFIVGYDLSASLAVEGCQRALEQAIRQATGQALPGLIHHSDHGIQYTAFTYVELLKHYGIRSSMGQVGSCYDNALAERVNGILKTEYLLDALFVDLQHAATAVHQAVHLYNYERPHLSLDYAKPAEIHLAK